MWTIEVYSIPGGENGAFVQCMQLYKDGVHIEWRQSKYGCVEYAEAEAQAIWPFAATVNGMAIEPPQRI